VEYLPPPSSDEPSPKPVSTGQPAFAQQQQQPQQKRHPLSWLGTAGAAIAAFLLKFKLLLLFGLKLSMPAWTFLLSLWVYVVFFGWRFAIVIMLLLLAHELGHYFAFRAYGLPVKLPSFVPLLGAFTQGQVPLDMEQDAYIALAGPMTGLALAAVCYGVGMATQDRFWFAVADVSAFLNLFNMLPVPPFDGGRVIGALNPILWIAGFALFIGVAIYMHIPLLFILIVGALGIPSMYSAWRGHVDPRAASMTNGARFRVGIWYLATLLGLFLMMSSAHAIASPAGQQSVLW
jgi:Zn-dependent protease